MKTLDAVILGHYKDDNNGKKKKKLVHLIIQRMASSDRGGRGKDYRPFPDAYMCTKLGLVCCRRYDCKVRLCIVTVDLTFAGKQVLRGQAMYRNT